MEKKYIITGGPGTGKTAIINQLKEKGYKCYEEVARKVITEQLKKGTSFIPWQDLKGFSEIVLEKMLEEYGSEGIASDIAFCDRAIPDIIAYLNHSDLSVHPGYFEKVLQCGYSSVAFIAPPWKDIYATDNERKESFEEAESLYHFIVSTYRSHGFTLHAIPQGSVEERVNFILSFLKG
jgi:predicted ATPase